jgi:hypothetical protein
VDVDEALERLHATADEYHGGLTNHGPMAVDALARLGHESAVGDWVREYERRLEPVPDDEAAPPAGLLDGDWRDVVRAELPQLLRGAVSAAGHGAIRAAHAVAMLEEQDTPPRRMELARALVYWRRKYEEVAAGPALREVASVRAALGRVASLAPPPPGPGFISDRLRSAGPVPAFDASIDDVVDAAAAALLASRPSSTIALVHAVTTPVALQVLAPYAPAGVAAAEAWLVAAALIAGYADALDPHPDAFFEFETFEDSVGRAIEGRDEHAIKLAAACAGRAAPVHAAVTAAVAGRLGRRR